MSKFNVDSQAVEKLAEILDSTGLSEIEYECEGRRIRVVRHITTAATVPMPVIASAPAALREDAPVHASRPLADHPGAVKSPMVGTAYLAPTPGADTFVKVGDKVKQGDTLLIIEAMKVMNPIRAPQAGTISSVLVQDAGPVEFGTVLVVIES